MSIPSALYHSLEIGFLWKAFEVVYVHESNFLILRQIVVHKKRYIRLKLAHYDRPRWTGRPYIVVASVKFKYSVAGTEAVITMVGIGRPPMRWQHPSRLWNIRGGHGTSRCRSMESSLSIPKFHLHPIDLLIGIVVINQELAKDIPPRVDTMQRIIGNYNTHECVKIEFCLAFIHGFFLGFVTIRLPKKQSPWMSIEMMVIGQKFWTSQETFATV